MSSNDDMKLEKRRRRPCRVETADEPDFLNWTQRPRDRSRRRFLSQLSVLAGGAGLLTSTGLPKMAHGQSREVDFSMLDNHASHEALIQHVAPSPEEPEAPQEQASGPADSAMGLAAPSSMGAAPPNSPPPVVPAATPPVAAGETAVEVTENRALWVEPGYLILVRITRAEDNPEAIVGFEESTEAVTEYLQREITESSHLHNVDSLRIHELAVANIVRERISPARLEVLHIDHDCTTVCSLLDPGHIYEELQVPGGIAPPGWE